VIGTDIREDVLQAARQRAVSIGVQNTCLFVLSSELADIVVSVDAFGFAAAIRDLICVYR
jgi:hypothetical protein